MSILNDGSLIREARDWENSMCPLRTFNSANEKAPAPFFANFGSSLETETFSTDISEISDKISKRIAFEILKDFILSETPPSGRMKQRFAHTASGNRISFASTASLAMVPSKNPTSRKKSTLSEKASGSKYSTDKNKQITRGKTHSRLRNLKPPPKQPNKPITK